jgi:hypothetical protein
MHRSNLGAMVEQHDWLSPYRTYQQDWHFLLFGYLTEYCFTSMCVNVLPLHALLFMWSITGACDCQPGHSGPDCSQCEAGYERVDMLPFFACTPSPGGAISGLSSDPSSSGNINPLAAGLVAGLLMALAAAVAIVLFFVWRTTRTETAPISDGSSDVDVKGKAPMQRPDTPPPSMGASSSHDEIEPTIVHSHDA